ncbi:4046_t:CDS:2, partial [Racocetra fulgida]
SNLFPVEFDTTADGTAVIRLQQRLPNRQCAESRVIMRYILPNGILVSNDVDFIFNPINFCPVDKIEIHPLAGKFSLVLYLNSTTPGVSTGNVLVQYAAMIINQDGKVVQNAPFMSNLPAKTKTVINNNGDFLWTFKLDSNNSITYVKFTSQKLNTAITDPTTPPTFTMSASGIFQIPGNLNLRLQNYTTFPTFYGHFAIAFIARYNTSSTTSALFAYCLITETISIPIGNISSNSIKTILFDPLYFGGYLQRIYLNNSEIIGNIFDIKGNLKGNWDLTSANLNFNNIVINGGSNGNEGGVGVFRNNTVILVLGDGGSGSTWNVVTTDVIKIYNPGTSKFCTLDSSNTVVTVTILQSTFNQPNEVYFIKIDDGFARSPATALVKLSNDFLNTSTTNHSQFLSQFISQLAQIIPVSLSRLSISSNFKSSSINSTRDSLTIPIIIGTGRNSEIRSARVINDLDTLIKNRDISPIGMMNLTSGIDKEFGAQWSCEYLQKFSWAYLKRNFLTPFSIQKQM